MRRRVAPHLNGRESCRARCAAPPRQAARRRDARAALRPQNVAGKKGQKWKPVPFTPWPEANKTQAEVVTEDAIFKKDVARLFGTVLDDKGVLASRLPSQGGKLPSAEL